MSKRTIELYVVRDKVARDVGPVFEAKNEAVAVRSYKSMLASHKFPEDFQLHRIGYLMVSDDGNTELVPELYIVPMEDGE